jgi:hypothetical protein
MLGQPRQSKKYGKVRRRRRRRRRRREGIQEKKNPVGERFSASVQAGSGAHPTAYTMSSGSLSRG